MVGPAGLEPAYDSYEEPVLAAELRAVEMVTVAGVEPTACHVGDGCSFLLSFTVL